jgi:hypothetical protein
MDTSKCKEQLKKHEDVARRKEVKGEDAGRRKGKLKHRQCRLLTLGLDQITKLYTTWMGSLVRVTYRSLTHCLFRLDRVKSSSCDCPSKSPVDVDVDSNASCFTCFGSGSSSPEVVEVCPTLLLGPKPPLAHYLAFIVCIATNSFKR